MPTSADDARPAAHPAQGAGSMQAEFPAVLDQQIGDLMFFEVGPEIFDRIEFGGIGGKFFQPEAAFALG